MDTGQNSPDALCAEILADAKRQSDDLARRARAEADSILAAATVEAEKFRRERREQARTEGDRRKEMILATVVVETNRLREQRVEELLESIRQAVLHRLAANDFNPHAGVLTLAVQAMRQLPGRSLTLKISARNHAAFASRLAEELRQQFVNPPVNFNISADATMDDGSVIVQSADGFQFYDNRLGARLERLWPELRRQIAQRTGLVEHNSTGGRR